MNARIAYLAGPLAFTGVQLVSPTLPLIAADLGLSNTELALVTSVYLFPAAVFALPAGFIADRWGRRLVLGWSMIVFGVCGALYLVVSNSFTLFLGVRFIQGLAFAAVLPLTITILGDSYTGAALVQAQGYRSLSLGIGEALLPILGGTLAVLSWETAWAVQALALPFGLIVLRFMDESSIPSGRRGASRGRDLGHLMRKPSILALQWIGVQRMFVKFALLAFLPVFLVETRSQSTGFVGFVLGAAAAVGVVVALGATRLTYRGSTATWVGVGMAAVGLAVAGLVTAPTPWLIVASALLYGAADGVTGVLSNSLVAVASSGDLRASFVAATGAVRNSAKFLAPTAFGLMVAVVPLGLSFVALGGISVVGALTVRYLGPLEQRLIGSNMETAT